MTLFEQLKAGLEDSIAHSRGELTLVTIKVPAPPPPLRAGAVKAIRAGLHMSQAVFAATLNVSKKTVQSWEQGTRQPGDAALRFLQVVKVQPAIVDTIFKVGTAARKRSLRKRTMSVGTAARARPSLARGT